ncbi:DnaD domain-containing protein [Companilactobacillus sp.]|jgi:DNA replication protein|uniref:DnaD domain-containing protein n=1 Tax=Companilactobacillus sp. TaxID=2767905 RepID=UPI0025BED4B2|nr:DnaD domain protein [Companilactobacillus sp.]MCH4008245.1 DnaD domain protein [Companilactobacillus sp.]MCH4051576.1 DnaD domain protein [Companilactobacillus sp.]MCH4076188.1 DnaD domain protein [Companilactobacillus sp.]MCH4124763.1 DnaD domain protein [Companilactobacillus sp.]MCH4131305.1 DnaD domain protein [Companilactobacillus sp.]
MDDKLFNRFLNSGSTNISNLIIENYRKLGMTNQELIIFLNLQMYAQQGNQFPMVQNISKNTGFEEPAIYNSIQNMIKLGIVELQTVVENHQQRDIYSLTPIFERIDALLKQENDSNAEKKLMSDTEELFKKIEVEFGRPISPIEQEQVHQWIDDDHYSIKLIELALREAVLNQAYSLKYMDRILISWEKSNIKTAEQLQERRKKLGY